MRRLGEERISIMKENKQTMNTCLGLRGIVLAVMVASLSGGMLASGQDAPAGGASAQTTNSSLVTINVDNGPMVQVLNAFRANRGGIS